MSDSQTALIMAYMKEYGSITVREARKPPICCERLAARIRDIRKAGVAVDTEIKYKISSVTKKPVKYAVYHLGGNDG